MITPRRISVAPMIGAAAGTGGLASRNALSGITDRCVNDGVGDLGFEGVEDIDVVVGYADAHQDTVGCGFEVETKERAASGLAFGEVAGRVLTVRQNQQVQPGGG